MAEGFIGAAFLVDSVDMSTFLVLLGSGMGWENESHFDAVGK